MAFSVEILHRPALNRPSIEMLSTVTAFFFSAYIRGTADRILVPEYRPMVRLVGYGFRCPASMTPFPR